MSDVSGFATDSRHPPCILLEDSGQNQTLVPGGAETFSLWGANLGWLWGGSRTLVAEQSSHGVANWAPRRS